MAAKYWGEIENFLQLNIDNSGKRIVGGNFVCSNNDELVFGKNITKNYILTK